MSVLVIPREATEEELEARHKELQPKKEPKPRGWAVYWQRNAPNFPYEPPPLITPEELKQYREGKGWFQKHLAIRTGYSPATIKNMESGVYKIPQMLSSMIHLLREVDALREENERLKASQEPS